MKRMLASGLCAAMLLGGVALPQAGAQSSTAFRYGAPNLSSGLTPGFQESEKPNELTKMRLALTYGETTKEEAQECAAHVNNVRNADGTMGANLKNATVEDCSWMEITGDDVRDAFGQIFAHPVIGIGSLVQRLFNVVYGILQLPSAALSSEGAKE